MVKHVKKVSFFAAVTEFRLKISGFLSALAFYLLIISITLTVILLLYCWAIGDWPFRYFGTWELNHGPWGYNFFGEHKGKLEVLGCIFILLIGAVVASFISMFLKFNKRTILAFSCSLLSQFLAMYYLYWLVD